MIHGPCEHRPHARSHTHTHTHTVCTPTNFVAHTCIPCARPISVTCALASLSPWTLFFVTVRRFALFFAVLFLLVATGYFWPSLTASIGPSSLGVGKFCLSIDSFYVVFVVIRGLGLLTCLLFYYPGLLS